MKLFQDKDFTGRDPRKGFFAHTAGVSGDPMLEIIKQLTGPAGLEWGACTGQSRRTCITSHSNSDHVPGRSSLALSFTIVRCPEPKWQTQCLGGRVAINKAV